jgi:hypothetical protein
MTPRLSPRRALSSAASFAVAIALVVGGCADDPRTKRSEDVLWPVAPITRESAEPVLYVERSAGVEYALPRAGQSGIVDLIALMPSSELERGDPNIFVSDIDAFNCRNDRVAERPGLPMEIEAVVTLHPRQYQKVPVCEQDERHYGTFTIEDDGGGIVVMRDSRVAIFSVGDRVRLTVTATMFTYREPQTRAILAADIERLDPPSADMDRAILYSGQTDAFDGEDVARTRRIEGYVVESPTNLNYGAMIIGSSFPGEPGEAEIDPVCESICMGRCQRNCGVNACETTICPALCRDGATDVDPDAVPTCWETNLDAELVRRGIGPQVGAHVAVTGPVVDSFGLKIWIQRIGQIETLR